MAENKTKLTDASVEDYILPRASEQQRSDCHELMALLEITAPRFIPSSARLDLRTSPADSQCP